MSERMTREEIEAKFASEHVLLDEPQTDEHLNLGYSITKQPAIRYSRSGRRAPPTSTLARDFGRGAAIGVGLFFLPFVFFPELVSAMLNVRSRQEPETKLKCAI